MTRSHRTGIQMLLTVLLTAIGLGVSALASWLEQNPSLALASHAAAIHTIGSAWLHIGAALVFVGITQNLIAPWFNLPDIVRGEGAFSDYSASERASLARTWAILISAIILGIAWAGA